MADPLAERREAKARLTALARKFVERASDRIRIVAAVLVGSVARGDFNVWSDIDVVVIAEALPERFLERQALLLEHAPPGVQPVAFTVAEFRTALAKGNRLAREALEAGVPLAGEQFLAETRLAVSS